MAKNRAESKAASKAARGRAAAPKPQLVSTATARAAFRRLAAHHHDAHCELDHADPFQLLVATVLSAQSTDVMVNRITPELFQRWPNAEALSKATIPELEAALARIGMFRQKSKNLLGLSKQLVERHAGQVPRTMAELVALPGVGRKTANVLLGVAFGAPEGVVVDTHVQRLSQRLGFSLHAEPSEIEPDLMRLFPRKEWDHLAHVLIFHGRRICTAQRPACAACPVNTACPSAFRAENVGRKPPRAGRPSPGVAQAKASKALAREPAADVQVVKVSRSKLNRAGKLVRAPG